jgi:uncharacterized protein
MLELRPNCELCDVDLPPASLEARICTYECTYCAACADRVLRNTCPTCGGNLVARPVRPAQAWRDGLNLGLGFDPPSTRRRHTRWTPEEIEALVRRLEAVPPDQR